jgi:GntR family transcriptional regulator / MocR family aminotransferase
LKRPVQSLLAQFRVQRSSRKPLSLQVCEFVRREILRGALSPGSYLPSTRSLARSLGVSRNTILRVYETLGIEGLVDGQSGAGTRINPALAVRLWRPPAGRPTANQILRAAHYPARVRRSEDPDGNPLIVQSAS